MTSENPLPPLPQRNRSQVAKDMLVFQFKLFADGFKDILLAPISLVAGLVSIFLSNQPGDMFYRVLQSGKNVERWIDLFSAARNRPDDIEQPLAPDDSSESNSGISNDANATEHVVRDFDSLLHSLQNSLLDPESRARISKQSLQQLNSLADRVRGKR